MVSELPKLLAFVVLVLHCSSVVWATGDMESDDAGAEGESGSSSGGAEDAQKKALEFINELRAKHHSPPLVLDAKITARAQKHAESVSDAQKLALSCKSGCDYGENLAMNVPNADLVKGVKISIQKWYDVSSTYDYKAGKGTTSKSTSSFTQMIWRSTKKAGVGIAVNKDTDCIYIVAQFSPAGNLMGGFQKNVLPPGGTAPSSAEDAATTEASEDAEDEDDGGSGPYMKPSTPQSVELQRLVRLRLGEMRTNHGVKPLTLDVDVVNSAQRWAESMATTGKLGISCKSKCRYGENVGMESRTSLLNAVNTTLQRWYDEGSKYDYKNAKPSSNTGDFTALVWKDSVKLGIGIAKRRSDGNIYVVFQFDPPGNVQGKYTQNVLAPIAPPKKSSKGK